MVGLGSRILLGIGILVLGFEVFGVKVEFGCRLWDLGWVLGLGLGHIGF